MNAYIEELRKILAQEDIDFRLVGELLELAIEELYREPLLLLGEEIEMERQKREKNHPTLQKNGLERESKGNGKENSKR